MEEIPDIKIVAKPVDEGQMDRLVTFLRSEDLPADDVSEPGRHFYFFEDEDEKFLGIGGFELYGSDALLRSVVTSPEIRGAGYGATMVELLLAEMRSRGADDIFLLTTGAEGFFLRLGFEIIDREAVPDSIRDTREYALLCPASATVMRRTLAGPQ